MRKELFLIPTSGSYVIEYIPHTASIAQLVERPLSEREVVGSNPAAARPHHTKGVKNGTSSSLADARIKGVVLGR